MKYHNITKDDMLNGDGLRVVLWVAGCENNCKGCKYEPERNYIANQSKTYNEILSVLNDKIKGNEISSEISFKNS